MLTEQEFLAELRAHIAKKYVTQKNAALMWGYSNNYVSAVVSGKKPPNDRILKEVGYKKNRNVEVTYEKLERYQSGCCC